MRVIDERSGNKRVVAFVITGDGRTEKEVLSALAERYNGRDKVLLFPKGSYSKKTGLEALNAVDEVFKLTGHTRYLVLLDREHFSEEKLHQKLSEIFTQYSLSGNNPYQIRSREIEICLVVLGKEKAIEEHIAELIWLETGEKLVAVPHLDIKALKSAIKTFLRTTGIKKRTKLIQTSKLENLEKAFKPLVEAIKLLEEET